MAPFETATATIFLLAILSPILLRILERLDWGSDLKSLLSFLIVVILVTGGQALDGTLTWPLSTEFWLSLFGAFGVQQTSFRILKAKNSRILNLVPTPLLTKDWNKLTKSSSSEINLHE